MNLITMQIIALAVVITTLFIVAYYKPNKK